MLLFQSDILSNLHAIWDIVLIAFVVRTHGGVCEVVGVQVEGGDGDAVHGLGPGLGEVDGSAEVRGVEAECVRDGSNARREETIRRASHRPALSLVCICSVLIVPRHNLTQLINIPFTS